MPVSRAQWVGRAGLLALALCLLGTSSGCTFVGGAIGAQFPRYETVSSPRGLPAGTSVKVVPTRATSEQYGTARPAPLRGRIVDNSGRTMLLRTDSGRTVAVDRNAVDVQAPNGSYWLAGAGIGLAVDVAIFMAVVVVPELNRMDTMWDSKARSYADSFH